MKEQIKDRLVIKNQSQIRQGFVFIIAALLFIFPVIFSSCNQGSGDLTITELDVTIVNHTPADQDVNVPVDASIDVSFSRGLKSTSINTGVFYLKSTSKNVKGSTSYSSAVAKFTPEKDLSYSTVYTATVKKGIESKAGAKLAADYTFSFTTAAVPVFTKTVPANNQNKVATNTKVRVTFPKPIDKTTLTTNTFYLQEGTGIVAASVSVNASGDAVLKPTDNLKAATQYTAIITTDLKYAAGVAYPKVHSWVFTTKAEPWMGIKQVNTPDSETSQAIAIDSSENVYVVGYGSGTLKDVTSDGVDALFIKYNSSGSRTLSKYFGDGTASEISDQAKDIAIDTDTGIYVVGNTGGVMTGTNAGGKDMFIRKFDTAGTADWTSQIGSTGDDEALGVDTFYNSKLVDIFVYVTGYTSGTFDSQTAAGAKDIFLTKYNQSSLKIWTALLGSAGDDVAHDVAVDQRGDVYITGYTTGALDSQPAIGAKDIFLAKYNKDGVKQWTRIHGTTLDEEGNALAIGPNGNIYITGYTTGTLTGGVDSLNNLHAIEYKDDPTTLDVNEGVNVTEGTKDIIIIKYNPEGILQWSKQHGGDLGVNEEAKDIVFDSADDFFITGSTQDALSDFTEDDNIADTNKNIFFSHYFSFFDYNYRVTRQYGTTLVDESFGIVPLTVTTSEGDVVESFVVGTTQGTLGTLNPSEGVEDIFIQKGDQSGDSY